jgi:hypothetical protein
MNDQLRPLSARIRTEIVELARVLHRVEEGWQRAQRAADDDYVDSVALNLHGFYSGSVPSVQQACRPDRRERHAERRPSVTVRVIRWWEGQQNPLGANDPWATVVTGMP